MRHYIPLLLIITVIISSCSRQVPVDTKVDIIPAPASVQVFEGNLDLSNAKIWIDPNLDKNSHDAIEVFRGQLEGITSAPCTVAKRKGSANILFLYEPNCDKEGYSVAVNSKKAVIKASTFNGILYSMESLRQLLPVEVYTGSSVKGSVSLPCIAIEDAPRFGYRGLHLDVSRHFFSIEEIKRYIDMMAMHKLNTFHWHLTDDQGWRVEIKKYPKLTEIGSQRKHTITGNAWAKNPEYDGIPYGGWYSQEQIKEVVAYAASKGITTIPEIDLPGHMLGALAAYPELGCTGGPYEVWGRWGVADDVLCPGKESTFEFIGNVLIEIMEMFPSEYIHIGGDECPKVRWEECPDCQSKIAELGLRDDDKFTAEQYLQSYVTKRVENFLAQHGRKIIGWDEILEGELSPDATIMSWRGSKGGIAAAELGHDAIMTPNTHFYFDYFQTRDQKGEPFPGPTYSFLPIEVTYSYEPFTEEMTDAHKSHILGIQANVWTEFITSDANLEYQYLPRLSALSEVQWCQQENKSWERFLEKMEHTRKIYEELGYMYAKHIFE